MNLRCAIAHRGISRFRVRIFDAPRNDGEKDHCFHIIASAAKQSIYPLCGEMDCFASLATTWKLGRAFFSLSFRGDATASNPESRDSPMRNCASEVHRCAMPRNDGAKFPYSSARSSFTLSVDGMFTTFIVAPFTNTFEANAQKHLVHCL